jgi:FkbM family methyltransferase
MNYAYLGDHTGLITTSTGRRMYVDTLDTIAAPHLIIDGHWESWVTAFLRAVVAPRSVFVDVGAHLGWYTLLAHECQCAHVHAFEPNPRLHDLLARTLSINGLSGATTLHQKALLDGTYSMRFEVPTHWSGNGRLDLKGDGQWGSARPGAGWSVDTCSLDSLGLGAVDFIKLDAEGAESRIIRGAEITIETNPSLRLLVEHHAIEYEYETMTWLHDRFGFRMAVVDHSSRLRELSVADLPSLPDSEMLYLVRG